MQKLKAPAANWNHVYCIVQITPVLKICTITFSTNVIPYEIDKIHQLTGKKPKIIVFTREELIRLKE